MRVITNFLEEQIKEVPIPKRPLGRTGVNITIIGLGGQGALESSSSNKYTNLQIIQEAFNQGINYFDTAPAYGPSEDLYGEVIPSFRDKIFLATKTDKRDKDGSLRLLEKSLKRLKTDYIDLWQIHHLTEFEEVFEVTGRNGALEAMLEMKDQGVVKFLGITGHSKPRVLLQAMEEYDWDTVLCPINPADAAMKEVFSKTVAAEAMRKNRGVIGMKVFSQGYIFHPDGITNPEEALTYALSQPISTVIIGHDTPQQLRENVAIAKTASLPISDNRLKEIEKKVSKYKKAGAFFRAEHGDYGSIDKLGPPHYPLERVKRYKEEH